MKFSDEMLSSDLPWLFKTWFPLVLSTFIIVALESLFGKSTNWAPSEVVSIVYFSPYVWVILSYLHVFWFFFFENWAFWLLCCRNSERYHSFLSETCFCCLFSFNLFSDLAGLFRSISPTECSLRCHASGGTLLAWAQSLWNGFARLSSCLDLSGKVSASTGIAPSR